MFFPSGKNNSFLNSLKKPMPQGKASAFLNCFKFVGKAACS
jgi:hypothetical protein